MSDKRRREFWIDVADIGKPYKRGDLYPYDPKFDDVHRFIELQPHERIFTRAEINDILSVFQVQQEYRHKILNELFSSKVKDE